MHFKVSSNAILFNDLVKKKAIPRNGDGVFTYKRTNSTLKYVYTECSAAMRKLPSCFTCLIR